MHFARNNKMNYLSYESTLSVESLDVSVAVCGVFFFLFFSLSEFCLKHENHHWISSCRRNMSIFSLVIFSGFWHFDIVFFGRGKQKKRDNVISCFGVALWIHVALLQESTLQDIQLISFDSLQWNKTHDRAAFDCYKKPSDRSWDVSVPLNFPYENSTSQRDIVNWRHWKIQGTWFSEFPNIRFRLNQVAGTCSIHCSMQPVA